MGSDPVSAIGVRSSPVKLVRHRKRAGFDESIFGAMVEGMDKLVGAGMSHDDATQTAVDAVMQAMDDRAPAVAATLHRTAPRMLRRRRWGHKLFERVMRIYWGQPLDLFLAICVAAEEAGRRFDDRLAAEAEVQQDHQFEALTGLYARACRTALEIHHLLAGGFPMAALARCRTLHEIAVIMMVLADYGEADEHRDLAERFLLHDAVLNWKDATIYQEHAAVLGGEQLDADELTELEEIKDYLVARFGLSYRQLYGWASGIGGLKDPKFADLEKLIKVAHLRGHYTWASHEIHADAKGWQLNVFERGDVLYKETGPMHFDLAEPATWALISTRQCLVTLLFSHDEVSPLEIQGLKALQLLMDEAADMFSAAEVRVQETDMLVLQYPMWRRRLWAWWRTAVRR